MRYRSILRHLGDDKLSVDPGIGDRELELQLHRHLADIEADLLEEGQEVLSSQYLEPEEYEDKLRRYLEKVDDVKKSDLAAYVSRRRVILDLLAKAIQADRNGRYAREDVVHSLIMPMRVTSDDAPESVSNLWVIEEGLAFHDYLASDKPIRSMPVTGSDSPLEPDLFALQVYDEPVLVAPGNSARLASIVVVEIKRPMRNDAAPGPEKDPVSAGTQVSQAGARRQGHDRLGTADSRGRGHPGVLLRDCGPDADGEGALHGVQPSFDPGQARLFRLQRQLQGVCRSHLLRPPAGDGAPAKPCLLRPPGTTG